MSAPDYDRVLREDADRFVTTVAVIADLRDLPPAEIAHEAIAHALARLTENGTLGTATAEPEDDEL